MSLQLDETWRLAASLDDLEEDEPKEVVFGETRIALCLVEGEVYAINNICTHEYACFSDGYIDGDQVECPLHQARFHIPSGKVLSPPACHDLSVYDVRVDGRDIFVKIEN